jgi:hypothetical protein
MTFLASHAGLLDGFRAEACFTLDYSLARMLHATRQLDEQQLWSRPHSEMNAVGNILLHVAGNLRQWIVVGCDPTHTMRDDRNRPSEFAQREPIPTAVLINRLEQTVQQAKDVIRSLDEAELLRTRHIQVGDITALGAIWHSVAHLEGHAQETIYAARLILGADYRFKDHY